MKGAIINPKVRNDIFFENFSTSEVDHFFHLIAYLLKNNIDAGHLEKQLGKYLFNYRRTEENTFNDIREIMIVRNQQDTTIQYFNDKYQILDRKSNLTLVAPKSAEIR